MLRKREENTRGADEMKMSGSGRAMPPASIPPLLACCGAPDGARPAPGPSSSERRPAGSQIPHSILPESAGTCDGLRQVRRRRQCDRLERCTLAVQGTRQKPPLPHPPTHPPGPQLLQRPQQAPPEGPGVEQALCLATLRVGGREERHAVQHEGARPIKHHLCWVVPSRAELGQDAGSHSWPAAHGCNAFSRTQRSPPGGPACRRRC